MSAISPYNPTTNFLFYPNQVSTCALWLDGQDRTSMVFSGNNVTTWKDKSGSGNDATATGNISNIVAINGNYAMAYPGTNSTYFRGNLVNTTSDSVTGFAVVNVFPSAFSAIRTISLGVIGSTDYGNNLYTPLIEKGGSGLNSYRNGSPKATGSYTAGNSAVVCSIYDGLNNNFYVNGTAGTPIASSGNFGYSNYQIGSEFGEESLVHYDGYIGEIIIFNKISLNTTQRQQVEGYLAWKWGVQSSLPTNHPYYNNPYITNLNAKFTPTLSVNAPTYSGMVLWLDASDSNSVTLSFGNSVSIWRDKSGLGNQAGTYVNYPLYMSNAVNGLNAISVSNAQFSGSLYGTGGAIIQNTSLQVFAVAMLNNNAQNFARLVSLGTPSGPDSNLNCNYYPLARYQSTNSLMIGISSATYNLNVPIPSYSTLFLAQSFTSTNTTAISVNGNTPSTFVRNFSTNFFIYRYGVGGQANANEPTYSLWNGYICEVLVYSNYFTQSQRQSVEGYLAYKWGLATLLPSNHPYYNPTFFSNITLPKTIKNYIYSPTVVSNLALWLDAADVSTIRLSGSNVTQWYDKSGETTTTVVSQPTLSGKYINTYQTLRFNNNYLTATMANAVGTGDYALFSVWLTINGGTEVLLSIGSNGNNAALGYNGSYYNLFEWGQTESDFTAGKNQYAVQSGTRISAVKSCFVNGSNAPTASGALNLADNTLYIGNSGFAINGEICEVLVFSNTINVYQRQQIEGYLAWKWNLQKSLPTSHPFYLFPPG